ncbi:MAG: betaine--homocysteine S-methyltransferase [Acidimicrobiia bacterium]|nr:betaine--homocysteine S-methyltransferase [Acidimicrobiia bacterium]
MAERKTTFTQLLEEKPVLVADGAMGTALFEGGLEPGGSPELLNVENPTLVESVHRSYVDAGADIVLTNTFGGNRLRMELHKLEDQVVELNVAAAHVARNATVDADRPVAVAGSIGPTGSLLEPYGLLTEPDAEAAFREQIKGLLEGGVDVLWIETMSSLEELQAAYRAAAETDLPIVATMSFDSHGHTMMGVHPRTLGSWAAETPRLTGAGANCGIGPEDIIAAAAGIKEAAPDVLVVAKGNCGIPLYSGMTLEYPTSADDMAGYVDDAIKSGARIIGACCGSTPAHIAAIRQRVNAVKVAN